MEITHTTTPRTFEEASEIDFALIRKQLLGGLDPALDSIIAVETLKANMEHYPLCDGVLHSQVERILKTQKRPEQLYASLLALCLASYDLYKFDINAQ